VVAGAVADDETLQQDREPLRSSRFDLVDHLAGPDLRAFEHVVPLVVDDVGLEVAQIRVAALEPFQQLIGRVPFIDDELRWRAVRRRFDNDLCDGLRDRRGGVLGPDFRDRRRRFRPAAQQDSRVSLKTM
jgi:hypothetical protein